MYNSDQIKNIDKYIKIIVDSREKKNCHILNFFEENKIDYTVRKLHFGDYSFELNDNNIIGKVIFDNFIVIERKNSLLELSGNLFKNRERFERELQRKGKTNFTLLIENAEGLEDIYKGYYRSRKQIISIDTLISKLKALDKKRVDFETVNRMLYDWNDHIPVTNPNAYRASLLSFEERYNFKTVFIQENKNTGKYIFDKFKYYIMEIMKRKNKIEKEKFITQL